MYYIIAYYNLIVCEETVLDKDDEEEGELLERERERERESGGGGDGAALINLHSSTAHSLHTSHTHLPARN